MPDAERIQAQLRYSATEAFDAIPSPPFTIFINPDDDTPHNNYAIPDIPTGGDLHEPLAELRSKFHARGRLARFEFLEAFAPELASSLGKEGFEEEGRTQLMIRGPEDLQPSTRAPGLEIRRLAGDAPLAEVAALLTVQRRGFGDEHAPEATEVDAEQFRRRFGKLQFFGAYLDGVPVSAGSLLAPYEGLSEVAGIATLPAYRGRGIATALTAFIARAAFDQGLDLVFLTAADARAGRVYERAGFRAIGSALAYVETGR